MTDEVDIKENGLLLDHPEVLRLLLLDQTTKQNIFWATDSYSDLGEGYQWGDPITVEHITGEHGNTIQPRSVKSREVQSQRSKDMAEVFTPSWVCNAQNNLADEKWFGRSDVFNHENEDHTWTPTEGKIVFPKGRWKTWRRYVDLNVLEVTCGEGPYLVSRYDTVTGEFIPVGNRIGLLDRKLRIVSENTSDSGEWLEWAKKAFMATYAFEWQGDSLMLAREAAFCTFIDYYHARFVELPPEHEMTAVAEIISWNLWQMDGLRGVVPGSCHPEKEADLFSPEKPCSGCRTGNIKRHNGSYCCIRDWKGRTGQKKRFVDMIGR